MSQVLFGCCTVDGETWLYAELGMFTASQQITLPLTRSNTEENETKELLFILGTLADTLARKWNAHRIDLEHKLFYATENTKACNAAKYAAWAEYK